VVDGGSTDGTKEYLETLSRENTVFISEADNGIYEAMNKALEMTERQNFVFFLNSRDTFADHRSLFEAKKVFEVHPDSNWGCTTHEEINKEGDGWLCKLVSPPSIPNQLFAYGYRSHQAVLMKSEFIRGLGGFDESFKIAADWDLITRALKIEIPLVWKYPLARFELGGFSSTRLLEAHRELFILRKKYMKSNFRFRILEKIWAAIYLHNLGYRNSISPIISRLFIHNIKKRKEAGSSKNQKLKISFLEIAEFLINKLPDFRGKSKLILWLETILFTIIILPKKIYWEANRRLNAYLLRSLGIQPYSSGNENSVY
jgi:glycosyltransferase involved in cell wall biosynthesis